MKCACCGQCSDDPTCPSCGEASWLEEDDGKEDSAKDAPKRRGRKPKADAS